MYLVNGIVVNRLNGQLILVFWSCNCDSSGWLCDQSGLICDQSGSNFANNKQRFRFWHFFQTLGIAQIIIGAARRKVILQRFPTAHKTSINPECLRVVPPALEQKFIEQNLPENLALCTERNSGGTMELVGNTHGLISTRACSSLQKTQWTLSKTRTDWWILKLAEKSVDLVENTHGIKNTRSTLSKTRACRTLVL